MQQRKQGSKREREESGSRGDQSRKAMRGAGGSSSSLASSVQGTSESMQETEDEEGVLDEQQLGRLVDKQAASAKKAARKRQKISRKARQREKKQALTKQ